MRTALANTLLRLARWLRAKNAPAALLGNQWTGTSFLDSFQRNRQPNNNDLLAELKGAAWTCATVNANVCATHAPRLYVATFTADQPVAKCPTRPLSAQTDKLLRARADLSHRLTKAARIEEVLEHPLLTLLQQVNPVHNAFNLYPNTLQ